MSKLRVAVLRGGPSSQYDLSLKTGGAVLKNMPEEYQAYDILLGKDGVWYRDGIAKNPDRALQGADVVFNALHGEYGEDGKVQKMLDSFNLPYTGSGVMASAIGMNKALSHDLFDKSGIKSPYHAVIRRADDVSEKINYVFHHFFLPIIVKPCSSGQSVGITLVKDFARLEEAIQNAFHYSDAVIIEEYLRGREAAVGVVDDFRHIPTYTLFPAEIRYDDSHEFCSHEVKKNSLAAISTPGNFTDQEKKIMQEIAAKIHELMRLRHYSQTDFVVTPHRGIYVLEVNSQPDLSENSPMAKSLEAIGADMPSFIRHILMQAMEEKRA